jgi:hypothetical protein
MSVKRYFQLCYIWPIVLPVVVIMLAGGVVANYIENGTPYVLFAGAMLLWSRGKEGSSVRRSTYVAPLLFLPVVAFSVVNATLRLSTYHRGAAEVLLGVFEYVLMLALPVLILAYSYVGLVNLVFVILKSFGVFPDESLRELALPSAGPGGEGEYPGVVAPHFEARGACNYPSGQRVGNAVGGAQAGGIPATPDSLYPGVSPYRFAGWEDEKVKGASRSSVEVAISAGSSASSATGSGVGEGFAGTQIPAPASPPASAPEGRMENRNMAGLTPYSHGRARREARSGRPIVARDPLRTAALGLLAPLILLSGFAVCRHFGISHQHGVGIHQVSNGPVVER